MKKIMLGASLLLWVVMLHAQEPAPKVFSRYNYWLPGQQSSVVCVVPDNNYQLILLKENKMIASTDTVRDGRLTLNATGTVQYRLLHNKEVSANGTIILNTLPAKSNAVQIDQLTGGLIADGLPFFPYGFYCGPVSDLPEKEVVHGFNMIGPYQDNLPSGYPVRKDYMDRCARLGIKVQYGVNSLIGSGHNGSKGLDKSDDEKLEILKNEIIAFRDHPALLSWYINDEPDGQGRPPKILEEAYQLIHSLDPYHPISIVFMLPSKADAFRHTMDIAMTDPYPIPGPADKVLEDVQKYSQAYQYEKSVWLVPQAFGGQEMWPREPTAQEIRLMTYMGLVSGVKGIQFYVHAAGNINPQSVSAWSACSNVAVETAQMASFLLSADAAPAIHTSDPKILTRAFRYKGNLLIIAVNNENKPKQLALDAALPETGEAQLWFENRSVPFNNGHISDIIDAYGTRVYLIQNKPTEDNSNLTLNPSFEKITSPGLAIGSNVTYTSRKKADHGATFFIDPRQSVDGMFSLRLITPSDSAGNKIRLVPMVMSNGNSYTVSIWAKAKANDNMPTFRLAMDVMEQTHTFTLTPEWKKYSFTFRAPISSTNAILALDLIQQGTAWFDMLQVSPDPVISYQINTDLTAIASIKSSSNAVLRYSFDKETDAKSPVYQLAIPVKKAATLYAALFENDKIIAGSKVFIPMNKALRKPVSFVNKYDIHYTAAGDSTLTDGIMGTTGFKDGKWLGFSGKDLNATIDMQTPATVNTVTTSFLADPNSGIFLPSEVTVYTSSDGNTFKLAGSVKNTKGSVRGEPYLQTFSIKVKGKQVRHIRIIAKTIGAIPDGYLFKGTTSWLFADEIIVE
jgi:hypothetical protein